MRYAIFFMPEPDTEIARLAARWLGRDAETGLSHPAPVARGLGASLHQRLIERPRRYGFHATLQAPFRLADGVGEEAVLESFRSFARSIDPVRVPVLSLGRHRDFFAFLPAVDNGELATIAREALLRFAPLRAPLTAAETARRRSGGLTPRQERHLEEHGYPYVLDEFRFHMTLTGAVGEGECGRVESILHEVFAPVVGQPLQVDRIALLLQREDEGFFEVIATAPLGDPLAYTRRVVRVDALPRARVSFFRR